MKSMEIRERIINSIKLYYDMGKLKHDEDALQQAMKELENHVQSFTGSIYAD